VVNASYYQSVRGAIHFLCSTTKELSGEEARGYPRFWVLDSIEQEEQEEDPQESLLGFTNT
jgi:hypothetical protein